MTLRKARARRRRVPRIAKGRRMDVRREEFNRLIDRLNECADVINRLVQENRDVQRDLQIQFQRIAQLQAEMDRMKAMYERLIGV